MDDEEYCRAYVNSVKGKGKRALQADLMKRGAKAQIIDKVLGEVEEDGDEALAVLRKYMRGKELTRENILKGCKYLLSKGYSYDLAKSASSALGDCDEDY